MIHHTAYVFPDCTIGKNCRIGAYAVIGSLGLLCKRGEDNKLTRVESKGSVIIEDMGEIAKIMRQLTTIPLWIKPNAGIPYLKDRKTFYPQEPEEMASFVPELIKEGAKIIGGCCGTTPEHIRLIREKVDSWQREN